MLRDAETGLDYFGIKGTDAIVPEPGDDQSVWWDLQGGDAGCDVRL